MSISDFRDELIVAIYKKLNTEHSEGYCGKFQAASTVYRSGEMRRLEKDQVGQQDHQTMRDLSALSNSQLCKALDDLGGSISDFKNDIVSELINRLLAEYPIGFVPWYGGIDDEKAEEHAEWVPVYERVKDSDDYQKRVSDVLGDLLKTGYSGQR